jgi:hypothetical protein
MRTLGLCALLTIGCGRRGYDDTVPFVEVDTDVDADTDADTDVDVDTDADTDTDTDPDTDPSGDCVEDADEPNDNFDAAIPRNSGVDLVVLEGSIEDYWTFQATSGQMYTVTVSHSVAAGNIDLAVYNPNEGSVAGSPSNTSNDVETVHFTANATGTFFARVTLRDGVGCNHYDLSVSSP